MQIISGHGENEMPKNEMPQLKRSQSGRTIARTGRRDCGKSVTNLKT